MSHPARNQTWQRTFSSRRLPGLQFRVGLCISTYVNSKSGLAWPAQETIGKDTRISPENVSAAIKHLIIKGWLSKEERPGGGLQYRLQFPEEGIQPNRVNPVQLDTETPDKDADQSEVAGIQPDKGALSSQIGEPYSAEGVTIEDNRSTEEGGASSATPLPSVNVDRSIDVDTETGDRAGRLSAASQSKVLEYAGVFTDLDESRDRLRLLIDMAGEYEVADRLYRNWRKREPMTSLWTWLDQQPELDISDMPEEDEAIGA